MELIITEQNGWKKSIKVQNALTRIGSAPASDIQLNSPGINPVHLQLHYSEETPSTCKLLNLGSEITVLQSGVRSTVLSYLTTEINDADEVFLGDYTIQFKLLAASKSASESGSIKAVLAFADATLHAGSTCTGVLSIKNAGLQSACQFHVTLGGFPADCMRVDPVPLLYPGAQEDIKVELFHRKLYPTAGVKELVVTISAPNSYPGEQVHIQQGIYVAPVFEQTLELFDDLTPAPQELQEQAPFIANVAEIPSIASVSATSSNVTKMGIPQVASPEKPVAVSTPQAVPEHPTQSISPIEETPVVSTVQAEDGVQETDQLVEQLEDGQNKPKLVRSPSEDFWNES